MKILIYETLWLMLSFDSFRTHQENQKAIAESDLTSPAVVLKICMTVGYPLYKIRASSLT